MQLVISLENEKQSGKGVTSECVDNFSETKNVIKILSGATDLNYLFYNGPKTTKIVMIFGRYNILKFEITKAAN